MTARDAEKQYQSLVSAILAGSRSAHLSEGKGFRSTGQLKVEGKIFATLVKGKLVVKLPANRWMRFSSWAAARHGRTRDGVRQRKG